MEATLGICSVDEEVDERVEEEFDSVLDEAGVEVIGTNACVKDGVGAAEVVFFGLSEKVRGTEASNPPKRVELAFSEALDGVPNRVDAVSFSTGAGRSILKLLTGAGATTSFCEALFSERGSCNDPGSDEVAERVGGVGSLCKTIVLCGPSSFVAKFTIPSPPQIAEKLRDSSVLN